MSAKLNLCVFILHKKGMTYPILKINNINIERVTDFNILGLIISSNLKWNKHIDHIALKISKVTGILYRLKSLFPRDALLTLYNALVMPHFHYCLLVWGSNVKDGHKLHLLQKRQFESLVIVITLHILNQFFSNFFIFINQ